MHDNPRITEGSASPCDPTRPDATASSRDAANGSHDELARLAAKARIVETLCTGDVRVLATELREGLEALAKRHDQARRDEATARA